jgi:hypothetical protein
VRGTLENATDFCPCGCGVRIANPPITVGNMWHASLPYWAWICPTQGCPRSLVEQRNQTGDAECPWCRHPRNLFAHFLPRAHCTRPGNRVTVRGEFVRNPPTRSTHYFQPPEDKIT